MITIAPPRPTELHARRVRLTAGPAAAGNARRQVRAAICAWQVPVDQDVAVLLTSDLVTSAIGPGAGETVTLAISCSRGALRVDVDGTSRPGSAQPDPGAGPEIGPGLILVATLADEWGFRRTPDGEAVYFTLAFQPGI